MFDRLLAAFCLLLMIAICVSWLIQVEQKNDILTNEDITLKAEVNRLKLQIEEYDRVVPLVSFLKKTLSPLEILEIEARAEAYR